MKIQSHGQPTSELNSPFMSLSIFLCLNEKCHDHKNKTIAMDKS